MTDFSQFNLPESLRHTLAHMEFTSPTPVQEQTIPVALEGRDVLGSAQTGTGKTGAFGIPIIAKLLDNNRGSALIMTPTRELATQVMQQLQKMLGKQSSIKTALLIGGESMGKQLQQLRNRPRLFVGTPGRINDHLERGSLMLHDVGILVLDETDRMLDMGFSIQIERIVKFMPKKRQTLLFSATLPNNIKTIAAKYLNDPVSIAIGAHSAPAQNITHDVIKLPAGEKYQQLLNELSGRDGSVITFVKTKHNADRMADKLIKAGHNAVAIHGDLRQNKRDRVIASFRKKKYRILVATDVAARGLDIPHIEHVINYDLPQSPDDYIHRIGRTARAGAEGEAICFVTPDDSEKWHAIHRLLDPEAAALEAPAPRGKKPAGNSKRRNNRSHGKPAGKPSPRGAHAASGKRTAERSPAAKKPGGNARRRPGGKSGAPRISKPGGQPAQHKQAQHG